MLLQSFLELPEQQHFPPLSRRTSSLSWDETCWHWLRDTRITFAFCSLPSSQSTRSSDTEGANSQLNTPPKANFWSVGIPLDAVPCPRRPDPEAVRAAGKGHGVLGFQRDPREGEAAACDGA